MTKSLCKQLSAMGRMGNGPRAMVAWGFPEPQERDHSWILQNTVVSYVARKGIVKVKTLI